MKGFFRTSDYQPDPKKDISEEIQAHLAMTADELMAQGMSEEEAWREAARRFGDREEVEEEAVREASARVRKVRLLDRAESSLQDVRFGIRTLLRTPGMTLLTILILAVGIGANTAIFSIFKAVFLEPLPLPEPEKLVFVWNWNTRDGGTGPASFPNFSDWREQNRSFEAMGAFGSTNLNLTDGDEPRRIRGGHVTAGVFQVLGVQPALGRTFLPEDDLSGNPVAVLSDQLWKERYAGNPGILGRTVQINGDPHTVIGVMPEGFLFPTPWGLTDPYLAWIPLRNDEWVQVRDANSYQVLARLREGVSVETAQEDLNSVAARLEEAYPDTNEDWRARVVPLHILLYGDSGGILLLIQFAAGIVLLIACGNIACFLLARATGRQAEMAIRASLGASRIRVIRQLLTESTLLALAGGLAASLLAFWGLDALTAFLPGTLPRTEGIRLDGGVLLFALVISLATGLLFGLAPARSASRTQLSETLSAGGRSGAGGRKASRSQSTFVVVQFALSLILANAGLLLIQSYASLRAEDQGFDGEHTVTMALTLDGPAYDETQERAVFFQQLLPRLEAVPGVRAAGVSSKLPLRGGTNGPAVSEAMWNEDPENRGILTEITYLDGDYFEAMGIPFLAGRPLGPQDSDAESPGVVINEAAANRFWPDENPLGKRFGFTGNPPSWRTVVGVVGNVRQWNPGSTPRPELYAHYNLRPRNRMLIVLNAEGDPKDLIAGARSAVGEVDPLLPLSEISTMGDILEEDMAGREFLTTLIGLFSLMALVLAAAGLYGVISYFVVRRTHELGVRLALGADRSRLVGMVLGKALRLVVTGLVVGAGGLWLSGRVLASLLFGVEPLDPPTIIGCVVLLVVVGAGAALLPGLRATRLSPVSALRVE